MSRRIINWIKWDLANATAWTSFIHSLYYALFFEDVLDIINICKTYRWKPEWLPLIRRAASRMAAYLEGVCYPDGQICLFNDAAFNMTPTLASLAAYARRLGIEAIEKAERGTGWKHWQDTDLVRIDQGP